MNCTLNVPLLFGLTELDSVADDVLSPRMAEEGLTRLNVYPLAPAVQVNVPVFFMVQVCVNMPR